MTDTTTIQIPTNLRDQLRENRKPHESNYGQTIARLLEESDGGQLWTEQEIKDIVKREIESVQREMVR